MQCTGKSLNPYYTGIHLHINIKYKNPFYGSLNPYYTGIHLHLFVEKSWY